MLRLPVRALAEFVHRRGDIHARLDGRTRAEEGIQTQRTLQRGRGDGYERERLVKLETVLAGLAVTIAGRIDGCDLTDATIVVEEFKTTRADPELSHAHYETVHWAQAELYGGLLARELGDDRSLRLRLIYAHPDTLATQSFERAVSAEQAAAFLDDTLQQYADWLERQHMHERLRNARLQALEFPFPSFRPYQRAVARRVFRALRDREHLLLEAPTGSGKTAATLFPAIRSLEAAGYRRVLLLTSRTTGALAARDAARRMDPDAAFLRHIVLTAKEKACFLPGTPCEPDVCLYARGYYDRAHGAVVDLLARRAIGPQEVAAVAQAHQVCPFELSLDASVWCDVVVGDYNYVFDPVVRLQRFAGDPETALLVDEAHQLAPRVRDMLSLCVTRQEVKLALAEALPEALARAARAIDRALGAVKRGIAGDTEQPIDRPDSLLRAMQRFVEALASGEHPLETLPATRDLLFNCSRWARSEAWYHADRFLHLAQVEGRGVRVRLACLDPGPYIRERLAEYGGHVRFSGTVSPLELYARLHGEPDAPVERAGNPFSAEQLRVLVVDDVPTYLRQRQQSLPRLLDLIAEVVASRPGHYLVAFPSFDYLALAADAYQARWPACQLLRQTPAMGEGARAEFLAAFSEDAPPRLGFVVLGGAFGESVDFSAARLTGIVCVSVGLPPPSATATALERRFTLEGIDGKSVAYHQPAMVKVLQMAGRLLRSPSDRGVLCLVDERFRHREYQQFFPAHWQPEVAKAAQVGTMLANFWQVP
jgi:DNA excision repair protein ERCC-2